MILVVGGTGVLGCQLVSDLVAQGEQVRVFARGVQPFPREWPDAVERVAGDLGSAEDCDRAVRGCTKVVFAASGFGLPSGGDPRSVDRDGAIRLIGAAAPSGVEHVVMMSMHGAAADGAIDLLRCKFAAEEALKSSGMAWTIIRMGVLLEQWIQVLSGPLQEKGTVTIFGSGTAPVTFTTIADASAIVRRALADPALRGRVLEWGSETHTLREVAEALVAQAGHGTIKTTPTAMLRVMSVVARPFSPFMARMAGASVWMDGGGLHLDVGRARAEVPGLPVHGLADVLSHASP
ncbi:MAG TPA: NAD(P)H-binding protein [Propionibacteriaceae bacterium]|nr:NAD(P)H-binding protein [Propionibacteriaceae bacterium]